MPLFIAALNSGSNGNCYYIGNQDDAILVDAGISCRETEKRMKRLGLDITRIRAIFISHEHGDHITGLPGISRKFNIPVYITPATLRDSRVPLSDNLVFTFKSHLPVTLGSLTVTAFPKFHDAIDPHSFIVSDGTVCIGILTDIGNSCKHVISHFKDCNAVFLEANYCEDMLEKGNYPYHLKKRISGSNGHLSNKQALELFLNHRGANLSHLILAHLSKNNNDPQLVEKLFKENAGNTNIIVASRYQETALYCIEPGFKAVLPAPKSVARQKHVSQLSLFN